MEGEARARRSHHVSMRGASCGCATRARPPPNTAPALGLGPASWPGGRCPRHSPAPAGRAEGAPGVACPAASVSPTHTTLPNRRRRTLALPPTQKNAPISEVAPPGGRPRWPCRTGMGGWGCGRGEGRACEERARAPSAGPFKRRRGGRARPSALVLPARPAPGGPAWPLAPGSAAAPPPSPRRRRSAARRPRRRPAWRGCVEREGESVSKQASKQKKLMRPSARRPPAPASLHLPLSPGLVVRLAARARPGGAGGGHGETRGVCVGQGVRAAAAGERAL